MCNKTGRMCTLYGRALVAIVMFEHHVSIQLVHALLGNAVAARGFLAPGATIILAPLPHPLPFTPLEVGILK